MATLTYSDAGGTGGTSTWETWVSDTTTSAWTNWNHYATTSTASTDTIVWRVWINGTETCGTYSASGWTTTEFIWGDWNEKYERTAEQKSIERHHRRQQQQAARERERERARSKVTARELLVAALSKEQRREFHADESFTVRGRNGVYKVTRGANPNVLIVEGMNQGRRLCAHPQVGVPEYDKMLAQKLHLEHDDEAFRRVANLH